MVEYERVNLKLSNQQIKKLKEAVKSNNGTTLRIGNKNFNKANLLHELFLTQTQINKLGEKVENKINKTKINLPKLIKPAISLGKNILAPLRLSAVMSATDAVIQKKMYGSGTKTVKKEFTELVIKDKELKKSHEHLCIF